MTAWSSMAGMGPFGTASQASLTGARADSMLGIRLPVAWSQPAHALMSLTISMTALRMRERAWNGDHR